MTCCNDFRYHMGLGTLKEAGHLGVCLTAPQTRLLVPLYYCPWCKTELRPEDSRPLGASYCDR